MFDFEEELKKLPEKPGVYIMHDANDAIIYVGKAIKRVKSKSVRQYFRPSHNEGIKKRSYGTADRTFEHIVTGLGIRSADLRV